MVWLVADKYRIEVVPFADLAVLQATIAMWSIEVALMTVSQHFFPS